MQQNQESHSDIYPGHEFFRSTDSVPEQNNKELVGDIRLMLAEQLPEGNTYLDLLLESPKSAAAATSKLIDELCSERGYDLTKAEAFDLAAALAEAVTAEIDSGTSDHAVECKQAVMDTIENWHTNLDNDIEIEQAKAA